jgi:hypothetical protein
MSDSKLKQRHLRRQQEKYPQLLVDSLAVIRGLKSRRKIQGILDCLIELQDKEKARGARGKSFLIRGYGSSYPPAVNFLSKREFKYEARNCTIPYEKVTSDLGKIMLGSGERIIAEVDGVSRFGRVGSNNRYLGYKLRSDEYDFHLDRSNIVGYMASELGISFPQREWSPHITLAVVSSRSDNDIFANKIMGIMEMHAPESITLNQPTFYT